MPKGQKAVIWNVEQDAKLFHAILAVHKIDFDTKAVAKAFGGNVPSSCIQLRLQKLRKKGRELGLGPQNAVMSTSYTSTSTKPSVKRKRGGILTSDSEGDDDHMLQETSENENTNAERIHTAPATPSRQTSIVGQVKKPRISPRKLAKKDYKAIEDPFADSGARDADGNEIFAESPDGESLDSEDEYGKAADTAVKREDETAV